MRNLASSYDSGECLSSERIEQNSATPLTAAGVGVGSDRAPPARARSDASDIGIAA